jgi:small-conductance mechanosensitive channel
LSGLYYLSFGLVVVLVVVASLVRSIATQDRKRLRAATILVVLHIITLITSSVLHTCTVRVWRDVELLARGFAGLAAVGMGSVIVFSVVLPRLHIITPVILRDVITGVTSIITVLTIAARTGFDFTSLITTSAVMTAVLGFSLQDTLVNVMAGLSVQMDDTIKVGDWIKVGDISGRVTEIRWRYTAVETRNWETVILPNSVITKTQVMVLGRRTGKPQQLRRWIWFNVDFRYAPSDVISVVTNALTAARIENVAADPPPNCILMELGESYSRFAVRYWLTDLHCGGATSRSRCRPTPRS